MTWSPLGTLSPTLETWRTLNAPAVGDLFRFSQTWNGLWPGKGSIQIRMLYSDTVYYEDAYFETKRLWPNRDERLIYLPFNSVMASAGYDFRYFQARISPSSKILATANWNLSIDEFLPDTPPPPPGTLDGGEY